jgi:hypothetical protein
MRAHLRRITPFELKKFQLNPKSVSIAIQGKDTEKHAAMIDALSQLEPISEKVRELNLGPEETKRAQNEMFQKIAAIAGGFGTESGQESLDLEKSWHVLHYLLTGSASEAPAPLGNAILGGSEIGDDLGYGPSRFLTPEQVREVSSALSSISKEDLANRFDLEAMMAANIYPVRDESELGLAQEYFGELSRFYAAAAAAGNAMLLYLV